MNEEPVLPFRVFVIGASSGGHSAVTTALKNIPTTINACFCVVIHSAFDSVSVFAEHLSRKISLPVVNAAHNQRLHPGTVYLAVPNNHLVVEQDTLLLSNGPRENLFRPAIDVLFRSAAVAYGHCCVGILLTGRLNDGTSGLAAIKRCGGLAIIENPNTAEYSDMPLSAQKVVDIDFISDLEDLSTLIQQIIDSPLPPSRPIPDDLKRESAIAIKIGSQVETEEILGEQVPFSCSSCGGPLWKIHDPLLERYRCHVGHSFTQEALLNSQNTALEETLWIALRTLEEKQSLMNRMVNEYTSKGFKSLARSYQNKLSEVSQHTERLRNLMKLHD